VYSVALQPDGRVLIAGLFSSVNGTAREMIARLNADGTLDATFQNVSLDDAIRVVAVEQDGRVLVGGDFTEVNGVPRGRVARLNADGSLDTTFMNAALNSDVTTIAKAPGHRPTSAEGSVSSV
jgi:uncharacterized delta-60 repeat protein